MESLIMPGILWGVCLILFLIWKLHDKQDLIDSNWGLPFVIVCGVAFVMSIAAPCTRNINSKNDAITATAYYEYIIQPLVVEEYKDYVIVDSFQGAIWQAGDLNLVAYNSYLQVKRHWDKNLIIGSFIYPVPEHLKLVKIKH